MEGYHGKYYSEYLPLTKVMPQLEVCSNGQFYKLYVNGKDVAILVDLIRECLDNYINSNPDPLNSLPSVITILHNTKANCLYIFPELLSEEDCNLMSRQGISLKDLYLVRKSALQLFPQLHSPAK